ncbi:hypothetical protein RB195_014362 [Necator americanus]|uniref:Uncharacterized protein n=1 Tax=Necator americanus TaxID=51031 RepID=A0ABR1E1D2_NECAM
MGRRYVRLDWRPLSTLNSSLAEHMKMKFSSVFSPGLVCCTKSKTKLALKLDSRASLVFDLVQHTSPGEKPVFLKSRPVLYAAITRISTEIDRLVSVHVLEAVDHSE